MPAEQIQPNLAVYRYMPSRHVEAFKLTAARFRVWILVRRGNAQSLKWIGQPGYIPKLLDCKAKTAEIDVNGNESTAGLVVSPILLPSAFTAAKLQTALDEWKKFKPLLYTFDPKIAQADDKAHKHYTVQLDKDHKHYGCVMYKPVFRALGEYIHADYDLYAVVPAADPRTNVRVRETGFGSTPHARSPKLYDVQYFLKSTGVLPGQEFGIPMVRHGEQETFKTDWNEKLDVFWPDGQTVSELIDQAAIRKFYATTLEGRRQFTKDTVAEPHFGQWERIRFT
jgi:hypothetical protein